MPTKVSIQPASEPITLSEAKLHLKVDFTADDALITALIQAAREAAEVYTNQKLITQTVEETFERFPCDSRQTPNGALRLTFSPLQSVTSLEYQLEAGTYTTLSDTLYTVHTYQKPSVITPAYSVSWPESIDYPEAIKVTYVAGFGTASDVPAGIIAAMLLMIGHWYENRQDTVRKMPTQAEWLLDKYRIFVF